MNRMLNLQMQLLLAQYGRKQVLEVLASVDGVDLGHIQRELRSMRSGLGGKVSKKKSARRKCARELVEAAKILPDIKPLVEQLALAYEAKEFLPELWRVRKFLEFEGFDASKLRSRADALPKLITVLSTYPHEKLQELIASWKEHGDRNDLALLTDAILVPAKSTEVVSRT